MTVELRDLSYSYGTRRALNNICLSVGGGELLCILGPNGAGKSTLFKCVLSLLRSYSGSILLDTIESRTLSAAELSRRIAYIPQSHQPTFEFTALEIVLMGAVDGGGIFAVPRRGDEERARACMDELGIGHLADRDYLRISGGERQLVLIARALAQQASILVMDEPTANLDYGNQIRVMDRVADLARNGLTILISTHNPDHAFLWATRVAVLVDGALAAEGKSAEILTEDMLRFIYQVEVTLFPIPGQNAGYRSCVPRSVLGKEFP